MEFTLTAAQEELKARARLAGSEWRGQAARWDPGGFARYPGIARRMGDLGLLGLTMPTEYGGCGGTALDYVLAVEEIIRASQCWLTVEPLFATSGPGPAMVLLAEREETRRKFLPSLVSGEKGCGIALT